MDHRVGGAEMGRGSQKSASSSKPEDRDFKITYDRVMTNSESNTGGVPLTIRGSIAGERSVEMTYDSSSQMNIGPDGSKLAIAAGCTVFAKSTMRTGGED